jgi:stage III sporulation protein AB
MTVKLIGAVFIIITASITGFRMSECVSLRENRLRLILLMTDKVSSLIEYGSLHVSEIISVLSADRAFEKLRFLKKTSELITSGKNFYDAWEQAVNGDGTLGEQEREVLLLIGSSLGRSNKKGQLSMLKLHSDSIRGIIALLTPELNSKKKLYSSLGVLSGVFLSVMLI